MDKYTSSSESDGEGFDLKVNNFAEPDMTVRVNVTEPSIDICLG